MVKANFSEHITQFCSSEIFTEGIPQNCIITLKNIYFFLLLACVGNLSISAQWVNNPTANKAFSSNTTHSEIEPVLVRDGSDGAIVILQDVNTTNLYAQKITANGLVTWGDSTQPVLLDRVPARTSNILL